MIHQRKTKRCLIGRETRERDQQTLGRDMEGFRTRVRKRGKSGLSQGARHTHACTTGRAEAPPHCLAQSLFDGEHVTVWFIGRTSGFRYGAGG